MQKNSNKVLVIVGPHSPFLYSVADALCKSNLNFINLETEKIFFSVLQDISRDYFAEEISNAEALTRRSFLHYLDLLYYIQKSSDKKVREFYINFYQKVQILNKVILYRFYEKLYFKALNIQKSGKNCVFVHNYFFSPYPIRLEIFFDFFKLFGNNLKTLNVYTSIEQSINLLQKNNDFFMDFVASKRNSYEAYKDIQNYEYDRQHIQNFYNPLLLLWLFPSMYRMSNIRENQDVLECISGRKLINVYTISLNQAKKLFGYIVQESYPYFYYKADLLNEVKNSAIFLNDSKVTYISLGNRIDSDYNLIFDSNNHENVLLPKKFLKCLSDWVKQDKYIPYREKKPEDKIQSCIDASIGSCLVYNLPSNSSEEGREFGANQIIDVSNNNKTDLILEGLIKNFLKLSKVVFHLITRDGLSIEYSLEKKSNEIELIYFNNNSLAVNLCEEHLILINLIYVKLAKKLNLHFFIKCIDLNAKSKK